MKKHLLTTAILGSLVFSAVPSLAGIPVTHGQTASQAGQNIDKKTVKASSQDKAELAKIRLMADDAMKALKDIDAARTALKAKDATKATTHLQSALGKLEAVIAINPDMKLLPLSEEEVVFDGYHTASGALAARHEAQNFLRRGMVQDARLIVKDLASEVDVRTTNIPLGVYADAIRAALPLVAAHNYTGADDLLAVAQKTIVVRDNIIPLPLIRMVTALEAAQAVEADKDGLSETDKQVVFDLLDYADEQMQLSVALGYADKGSYKQTRKLLHTMRKNVAKQVSNTKAYKKALSDVKATNSKLESAKDRADKKAETQK